MAAYNRQHGHGNTQEKGSNRNAAPAGIIGEPFHNPYTFIPFPDQVARNLPTALTADELPTQLGRKSGVLELTVKTLSPLMTCHPVPEKETKGHKAYKALTIGPDVILPATGVRGAVRTLLTVITGGTLGYMDEDLRLTQGRDARLGPSKKMPGVPDNVFLAEVVSPGTAQKPGKIRLGRTKLILADKLRRRIPDLDRKRQKTWEHKLTWDEGDGDAWRVKLSGRPVNRRAKKEGLFKPEGESLELPARFWAAYQGSHRHAVRKTLKKGDLVWLEPMRTDCTKISTADDIKSLQWARWGRRGKALKKMIPRVVLPDSMNPDGGVDIVTDLFGQIPHPDVKSAAGPFAARVRTGNLVFEDAASKVTREILAPLAPPHPGCLAFYRDWDDLDQLDGETPLKGYKVYRNTEERGENAPWRYRVQGVYHEKGALKTPEQQKVNKTAQLLPQDLTGTLRISFRALDPDELALLCAACTVDWKLGGGKPLGLGHCRVVSLKLMDEEGNAKEPLEMQAPEGNLTLPEDLARRVQQYEKRIALYRTSQVPVPKLRYPRAVTQNRNKSNRAGLSWFARHAAPRKIGKGLETIWTTGELRKTANATQIKAQALPRLDPNDPDADLLYGYDVVELDVSRSKRNQRMVGRMELFDAQTHAGEDEQAGENISQSRKSRASERAARKPDNCKGRK